ncbi:PREDICTED: F-box/kelch-repeat protein At3g16740-like [Camelina sativa]|uniref:F-box/kelch-repeat protein At3g16740-like n=1 Tax=Camelina sativa TaxID=90675 RepID=A0ABM0WAV3_CAMSA|nr:PREDICTED: F-box/kelch-repeat protein At3g16740-like [Camelina sativa]
MLSDLPRDVAEDVLNRLPITSMRAVRFVCKNWNALSKDESFTKKHLAQAKAAAGAREFITVMVINYRVYLMSVNLHGIHNNVDPSINHLGKLVSLTDSDRVDISVVYHCDGLLLCITRNIPRFVVWNPYCGQTRWFETIRRPNPRYAIGYENSKSCRSYKVLRFCEPSRGYVRYELYHINSKSPSDVMSIPITIFPDWDIEFYARGVSLKGNTYWFAQENCAGDDGTEIGYQDFLICFDFTKERFGRRLSLPFHSIMEDTVTLSSVRDEQLAVLFQEEDTLHLEIWITTKIEPEAVSWGKKVFLAVNMKPLDDYAFDVTSGSFFVDEEKKVAVVFDIDRGTGMVTGMDCFAYIIGKDGYFKKVDLGDPSEDCSFPLMCSYVPSLVQIERPTRSGKRKRQGKK